MHAAKSLRNALHRILITSLPHAATWLPPGSVSACLDVPSGGSKPHNEEELGGWATRLGLTDGSVVKCHATTETAMIWKEAQSLI
jgi:hypothetical protein